MHCTLAPAASPRRPLMIVEASKSVPWTKAEDLEYDNDKPLPKLGVFPGGFNAGFCDASVRFIKSSAPEKTLRALITRNDGKTIDFRELE
jgi:hypothetical protein